MSECAHSKWETDEIRKAFRAVNHDMVGHIQTCPSCHEMTAFRMTVTMLMPEEPAKPLTSKEGRRCERCHGSCVSRERFDQEQRAYIAAEHRYMKLSDWLDAAPERGFPLGQEAYEYAVRCVPMRGQNAQNSQARGTE